MSTSTNTFPCDEYPITHYTAYRVDAPISINGKLDQPAWQAALISSRFVDLVSGKPTIHDTRVAILWDDQYLYVGFWIEEPLVAAKLTQRDSLVWTENDVEVFIAAENAYYEFEINALGTIYEALFVWEDHYERACYNLLPGMARDSAGARYWNGVGFTTHPRGPRIGFFEWDLDGLQSAVHIDGTINDHSDRDRGWTVELAFPWAALREIVRGEQRSTPPVNGDIWRMDFSRFNTYKEASPSEDSGGWTLSSHHVWDSHVPECFPYIHFSTELVTAR
ncbi:MAG TPA: carbohydrate-binding family 9-like protein [Anaerolineae bacterium]|jgi:hypothetical protein